MKPARFDYAAPASVDEAVGLLGDLGEDAKVLAGGQSLVPLMNFRLARPAAIVDVNGLDELAYVRESPDAGLSVGALTRQGDLERSGAALSRFPVLAEALRHVGHAQIRNRGTIGGSVAHADPAAELPCVLTALDARFVLRSVAGQREVGAEELFVDVFTTAIAPEELLVEVRVPALPDGGGQAFLEFARRHGDFALGGACALLWVEPDGRCSRARLALLAAGPRPVRAAGAEGALVGSRLDAADLEAAAEAATADLAPSADMHGSAEYRKDLLRVMARRALETAAHRLPPPPPSRGRAQDLAGAAGPSTQAVKTVPVKAVPVKTVQVTVNGTPIEAAVEARKTLADFIREEAGLTGTHLGCEHGVCGACTVQLDGRPVRSCLLFAVQAHGHQVRTVEALAPDPDGELHPLQQAFHEAHALQCGFCTPGFLMSLEPFLRQAPNPTPTEDEIREALSGNLCRCTGYQNIVEAVRLAARRAAGGPA